MSLTDTQVSKTICRPYCMSILLISYSS